MPQEWKWNCNRKSLLCVTLGNGANWNVLRKKYHFIRCAHCQRQIFCSLFCSSSSHPKYLSTLYFFHVVLASASPSAASSLAASRCKWWELLLLCYRVILHDLNTFTSAALFIRFIHCIPKTNFFYYFLCFVGLGAARPSSASEWVFSMHRKYYANLVHMFSIARDRLWRCLQSALYKTENMVQISSDHSLRLAWWMLLWLLLFSESKNVMALIH